MGFCAGWQGIGGQRVASHDASMREAALYSLERGSRSSALIPLRVALLSVLAGMLPSCASIHTASSSSAGAYSVAALRGRNGGPRGHSPGSRENSSGVPVSSHDMLTAVSCATSEHVNLD